MLQSTASGTPATHSKEMKQHFTNEHQERNLKFRNVLRTFIVKLLVSNVWNTFWFLVVSIFNIVVAVGVSNLKGSGRTVCSYKQEPVTRLLPALVLSPYASFVLNFFGESLAALLTLWAMLHSFGDKSTSSYKTSDAGSIA
jgi:hypothetical protein